jgi:hypothetical protein
VSYQNHKYNLWPNAKLLNVTVGSPYMLAVGVTVLKAEVYAVEVALCMDFLEILANDKTSKL